jgi:hypothetical protein
MSENIPAGFFGNRWDELLARYDGQELHRSFAWSGRPKMAVRWTGRKAVLVLPNGVVLAEDAWHPDFDEVQATDWEIRPQSPV